MKRDNTAAGAVRGVTLERVEIWLTRRRASVAGEVIWAVFLATAIALQAAAIGPALSRPDLVDFGAFRDNALAWLSGTPYPATSRDPNAPHVILLFVPFTAVSLRTGLLIWLGISYACAWITLTWIRRETSLRLSAQLKTAGLALFAVSPATLDVVTNGNMIWPLWWMFTATWVLTRHGRLFTGGLVLGVLMTAKPFLALWLPYYALRREWRALAGALAGAAGALIVGVSLAGTTTWLAWVEALHRITWFGSKFNASTMGVIARIWHPDVAVWLLSGLIVAGVTAIWLMRQPPDVDRDWLLVLFAALLIGPLGWRYYYCFGLGPLIGWLRRSPITPVEVALLLALAICPAVGSYQSSLFTRATIGSLTFWLLLAAWLVLGSKTDQPSSA